MAHPMREEARDDHDAKVKAFTSGYSGSTEKEKPFLRDKIKHGPEEQVGMRAEGGRMKHRADRRASGGAVKKRASGGNVILRAKGGVAKRASGGDVSSIEEANRDQAMSSPEKRASGGRTKGKKGGHTHVNVIVAPQGGGGGGAGPMPPMGVHPVPPMLPPGAGPGMPPPGAGAMPPGMPPRPPMMPPPGAMPPPGLPPGAALASGGRVRARAGGGKIAFEKGEPTRRAPEEPEEPSRVKVPARAKGGTVEDPGDRIAESMKEQGLHRSNKAERAHGGRTEHHMTAGGHSGVGRLQKIGKAPHDAGKPQIV